MTESENLSPLLEPLAALQRLISHFDDQGMVIGGIAASLLGKPRLTADLDAVILLSADQIPHLIKSAEQEGFITRIKNAADFARTNRILLIRHEASGTDVDISLGVLPFEVEAVERSNILIVGGLSIRLPTPEDLIILKGVAHRPKDLQDIETIAAVNPSLDKERVEFWLLEFAEILDKPEIWDDVRVILEKTV